MSEQNNLPQRPFSEGNAVLLIDARGRRYLVTLEAGKTFHSHLGTLSHDAIIGSEDGSRFHTAQGRKVLVVRPRLADFILETPHITQVIYPKDLGTILMEADIYPGATVLEAGIGSGALTMALLRAVGSGGQVISYEIREDMLKRAIKNITPVLPNRPNHTTRLDDICNGISENEIDRIILDLPEPWRVVPHVAQALVPGGILLCFLPTVLQVHRLVETLDSSPFFDLINTLETFQRPWHVTKQSMRPEHRMVAHTGFLTTARLCSPSKKTISPDIEQESGETREDLTT